MLRAQKAVLTFVGITALTSLVAACGMVEEQDEDNVGEIDHEDGIHPALYGAKVTICHHTNSRTNPTVTLEVSSTALSSHLEHGDTAGACGTCVPTEETCGDGLDNDCDTIVDEGCPPTPPCVPTPEVCDGIDNDCDGSVDEGGVCCVPTAEVCDGVDNDCDGSVDEDGACDPVCVPSSETCDGVDNDCDGVVDEGCIGVHAWFDANENGLQDAESGSAGVILVLRNAAGAAVQIQVSNSSGDAIFSGVATGTYFFEVVPPAGFTPTAMDVGTNDEIDSDFDTAAATTELFIYEGGFLTSIDAGFVPVPEG
jgi:hypothetical protein